MKLTIVKLDSGIFEHKIGSNNPIYSNNLMLDIQGNDVFLTSKKLNESFTLNEVFVMENIDADEVNYETGKELAETLKTLSYPNFNTAGATAQNDLKKIYQARVYFNEVGGGIYNVDNIIEDENTIGDISISYNDINGTIDLTSDNLFNKCYIWATPNIYGDNGIQTIASYINTLSNAKIIVDSLQTIGSFATKGIPLQIKIEKFI